MHQILLGITEQQKQKLYKIKEKTGEHVTVQIRKAIDQYLEKNKEILTTK